MTIYRSLTPLRKVILPS